MTVNRETRTDNLIEPVYQHDQPNDSISLGSHRARIVSGSLDTKCQVDIEMQFMPRTRILIRTPPIDHDKHPLSFLSDKDEGRNDQVVLLDQDISIPVITSSTRSSLQGTVEVVMGPRREPLDVFPKATSLQNAVAQLFNFPKFYGGTDYSIHSEGRQTLCGRIELESDEWQMTIAALNDTDNREKSLKQTGGYLLTHMVEFKRADDQTFTSEKLINQVQLLHYYLSFVTGRWAGLGFVQGYDREKELLWERWGLPDAHRDVWFNGASWFDAHHGGMIHDAFPGFVQTWTDPVWNDPLRHAIYWYIAANVSQTGVGVDTRLILAQTALETLAWTHCVQSKKMVSPDAFGRGGLSAADKLRLLLSSCGIPREVPGHMKAMQGRRGKKWKDGPDAITGIRNQLVHPGKRGKLPDKSFYEASVLALWYIEMTILRVTGYAGAYSNRLEPHRVGKVEPVPWSSNSEHITDENAS